ncbi:polymorphic toxin-type HINT domain-containing protein [Micromonospora sp. NBC_01638]|uniref:polymorphic toxin-type HINT domain-containing protein n=1 Tax=Micromonospora sp. NBC_01638 TaxID=2975982 RepID=UPI003868D67F|nr:HINT domain-containing protein [Micromonospora sp. NBC_01638]
MADGTVTATDGHPFWVDDKQEWLRADHLNPGDLLLSPDGARVSVIAVVAYGAVATVHNLTVDDIHTYYVLVGDTDVLVHNQGGADEICELDPSAIRFTQDSIKNDFQDGRGSVLELAEQLRRGDVRADSIPPIRIFRENGKTFTLDNQRPVAFQIAQKKDPCYLGEGARGFPGAP